ncbi:hypothetical protein [Gryllotalpicola ginsengisoli]|uniref:hypothetical protein n=1 Tax=Gryllotalpicola ginsengisoli TaxID=444608 RepID=UPI0003B66D35|nr:hypothetical protein [Gryllotalpicola ginsengisoli]
MPSASPSSPAGRSLQARRSTAHPFWSSVTGEVRRTTWYDDGLDMTAARFAATREPLRLGVRPISPRAWSFAGLEDGRLTVAGTADDAGTDAAAEADAERAVRKVLDLLLPEEALARFVLEPIAEARVRRRLVRSFTARWREPHDGPAPFGMRHGGEAFRFRIDVKSGIVVQATAFAAGSVVERVELHRLAISALDAPPIGERILV